MMSFMHRKTPAWSCSSRIRLPPSSKMEFQRPMSQQQGTHPVPQKQGAPTSQQSSLPQQVVSSSSTTAAQQQIVYSSPIATATPSELARLFDQFVRQAYSQTVPSTRPAPAPLSPASIDGSANGLPAATQSLQQNTTLAASATFPTPYTQLQQVQPLPQVQLLPQVQPQPQQVQPQLQQQVQPQLQQGQPQLQQIQPQLQQVQPPSQQLQHQLQPVQLPPQQLQQLQLPHYTAQQLSVPVPTQLQQQILRGEYVDFSVLLDKTSFVDTTHTTQHSTHKPPPISSFPMWMQAWNTYLTVTLTHNPARALELVGYQRIITSASQSLPLKAWLRYDSQFHTMAASNPYLRWDQRLPDLWHGTVTSTTNTNTQRWPCPYCGAKNHFPDNFPHSPFCDSSQRTRPPNRREPGPPICGDYNDGQCSINACIYQHICLYCKGRHPRVSCPDRRPVIHKQ